MMKKNLKNLAYVVLMMAFVFPFTSCGDDVIDTSAAGGSSDEIVLAAVSEDNQTTVTVPADYFGDDLTQASFDVFVNGTQIGSDLDPSADSFYDDTTETVDFAISSVNDGDIVSLSITDADGVVDSYSATISADAATFAVSVTE